MWVFAPFAVIKAPALAGGYRVVLTGPAGGGIFDPFPASGLTDAQKIKGPVAVGFPQKSLFSRLFKQKRQRKEGILLTEKE